MPEQGGIPDKIADLGKEILDPRGVRHHRVGDSRQLGDDRRNPAAGMHERRPALFLAVSAEADQADLDHGILVGIESGGLNVEGYDCFFCGHSRGRF